MTTTPREERLHLRGITATTPTQDRKCPLSESDDEYDFSDVPSDQLASEIAYSATVLANTPAGELEAIREDLLEAAILIIPAAVYVEERAEREHHPSVQMAPVPTLTFLPQAS